MNKAVKQQEFKDFRRAINISIDRLNQRMHEIDRAPGGVATRREMQSEHYLNSAKFDAIEQTINQIIDVLNREGIIKHTCPNCQQELPKDNHEG